MQQEFEYIYEYEQEQSEGQDAERAAPFPEQSKALLAEEMKDEEGEQDSANSAARILEEIQDQRATRLLGRGLVVSLVVCVLLNLAALWLSGTLISAPTQMLPLDFLQILAAHRMLVLGVPAACLVICYFGLRSLTQEIMAVPERRLDERQKMLRDQAQRTSYKIIKYASLLIPVGFLLPHLPWFNAGPGPAIIPRMILFSMYGPNGSGIQGVEFQNDPTMHWRRFGLTILDNGMVQNMSQMQPASNQEIALAGGVLLLGLILLFSALPMAVLAWKGKA